MIAQIIKKKDYASDNNESEQEINRQEVPKFGIRFGGKQLETVLSHEVEDPTCIGKGTKGSYTAVDVNEIYVAFGRYVRKGREGYVATEAWINVPGSARVLVEYDQNSEIYLYQKSGDSRWRVINGKPRPLIKGDEKGRPRVE